MRFEPTPKNSTIDGSPWRKSGVKWGDLDWSRKVWREKASIMVAVLGSDAPPDPHWSVPHKDSEWGTWHRVRAK